MRKTKSEHFRVDIYGVETFPIARVYRRQKSRKTGREKWVQVTSDQPLGHPKATGKQLSTWIGDVIVAHSCTFRQWLTKK